MAKLASLLAFALALTACDRPSTAPIDVQSAALDVLADLACLRDVVDLLARVAPNGSQSIRDKLASGSPLEPAERELALETIDRLRAAGQCLAKH